MYMCVHVCTSGSVLPRRGAITGLDEHLLATCLYHVNVLTNLLEGHLLREKTHTQNQTLITST